MRIAPLYTLFAAAAIVLNLLVQAALTRLVPGPFSFWVALAGGTGAGLLLKYHLDKQYIFRARHLVRAGELGRSFLLYSLAGLLTTAVFWGTQLAFHRSFPAWPGAKYLGGTLGLILGYLWKYQLDKRHAFASSAPSVPVTPSQSAPP